MSKTASTGIGEELHLVFLTHRGDLYHRVRQANGEWTPWGKIRGGRFVSVTSADVAGDLHVTVENDSGVWFHNIRHHDGRWQGFAQLPDQPLLEE